MTRLFGLTVLAAFASLLLAGSASAQCLSPAGDINNDDTTDIVDIQCAILVSLNELAGGGAEGLPGCLQVPTTAVDINCDSEDANPKIDIADLLLIVNYAFDIPLPDLVDPNADNCPDACEVPGSLYNVPVWATGTTAGGGFTLKATGGANPGNVPMTGNGFVLEPRAVGFEE